MTTATRTTIDLRIIGRRLPGLRWGCYDSVHVGVQRQRQAEIVGLVPGDAAEAVFDLSVDVVTDGQGLDFRGPFVQGRRGERFVYLSWGEVGPHGGFEMFRRAKLHLSALAAGDVTRAVRAGSRIEAVLDLTDEHGGPVCAAVRPPRVQWRVPAAPAAQPGPAAGGSAGGR
jgi:Family of unknown function (DUF5990)